MPFPFTTKCQRAILYEHFTANDVCMHHLSIERITHANSRRLKNLDFMHFPIEKLLKQSINP